MDGTAFPGNSLWIYANNDPFYSIAHSRSNHDAFTQAGGIADFQVFTRAPGPNGHFIINDGALWGPAVAAYLSWFE